MQQQDRTPALVTVRQQAAPEVSPLVQRGETAVPVGKQGVRNSEQVVLDNQPACCPTCAALSLPNQPGMHSPTAGAGLILNEETGHIIGIGKGTYNRLGVWWAGEASCS